MPQSLLHVVDAPYVLAVVAVVVAVSAAAVLAFAAYLPHTPLVEYFGIWDDRFIAEDMP